MSAEEWRPIPGHEGYEASSQGRIRSWRVKGKTGKRADNPTIMQGTLDPRGWRRVCTAYGTQRVHALVMLAFVGPRPDGLETRHLDGDKSNNTPSNLVYGTHLENMRDLLAHGANHNVNKTHCPQGHPYTEANTYRYGTRRHCKTCIKASGRRRRQAKAAA